MSITNQHFSISSVFFVFISTSPSHQLSLLPSLFCSPWYPFPFISPGLGEEDLDDNRMTHCHGVGSANHRQTISQPTNHRGTISQPTNHSWTISHGTPITSGQYHNQSQGDNITADQAQGDNITANQSQVDNITADQSQVDNISGLLAWGEGLKKSVFFLKTSLNQLNTVFLNYSTERTVF